MLLPASAASETDAKLQFNDDGKFRIMQISDIQDGPFLLDITRDYIEEMVVYAKPDLVVLSGDNISAGASTVGIHAIDLLLVKAAIGRYMSIFEKYDIPVAVVFGNHDAEEIVSKEEQMEIYMSYDCCVAVDDGEALYGCGTYNLPIYSSKDADKMMYNLWMFDSNTYDEELGGYDYVHDDQVEWYVNKSNELKAANGGVAVPSMAFQHIIVGEIMDVFYKEKSEVAISFDSKFCNGKEYDLTFADFSAIKDGMLTEPPCPGVENFGQFDALVEQGTVAVFSGHDHVNTFTVELNGVDIVNTPGCTFNSYGQDYNRGGRLITLHEGETEYDSEVLLLAEEAMDSDIISLNFFSKVFGILINKIILAFFNLF
jgi:hypothetical protein